MVHDIKLDISFCDPVYNNIKTFEIRRNDRNYQVGDYIRFKPVGLLFQEVDHPIKYNLYEITYILSGWGLQEGFCALAIKQISKEEAQRKDLQKQINENIIN